MRDADTARPARPPFGPAGAGWERADLAGLLAILAAAALLSWLTRAHPAALPAWAPWEFSWGEFLAAACAMVWYARGIALLPRGEAPGLWRQAAFAAGVVAIYAVLLTHFDYGAQHMFFLNRVQHLVMHHLGPFLIALAWPGAALARGMPAPLRRLLGHPLLGRAMHAIQQPILAAALFAGLILLWLTPAVHFRAMLDPRLYDAMNWSMVIDGVLFWVLVLDPRPWPEARTTYTMRMLLCIGVMFPQIVAGAALTMTHYALYDSYDLCGRLYPAIDALSDQHIGGSIVWIPGPMMSSIAFLLVLTNMRRHEDRLLAAGVDPNAHANLLGRRWMGL